MNDDIKNILSEFQAITLGEMEGVKLMNRVDTKFIINNSRLPFLLQAAASRYFVLEIDGQRQTPYSTIYFDTDDLIMYTMHHNGKKDRFKVRMRVYENSGQSFLEVKRKNNKGRTNKRRIEIQKEQFNEMEFKEDNLDFMLQRVPYSPESLKPVLQNFFQRITLVDNNLTERITIDIGLKFRNVETDSMVPMDELIIIEIKQDGALKSVFRTFLEQMHVFPGSMSKYCLGMVMVMPGIKYNRFKNKIRKINKITKAEYVTN